MLVKGTNNSNYEVNLREIKMIEFDLATTNCWVYFGGGLEICISRDEADKIIKAIRKPNDKRKPVEK